MAIKIWAKAAVVVFIAVSADAASGWAQSRTNAGYLSPAEIPDVIHIVPPAPQTGDPRFQADMAIFRSTRSLEGSPRWALAQSDDNLSLAGLFHAFRCALRLELTPETAPKTAALLTKAIKDASAASTTLKDFYRHKRPFQVAEGNVCLSQKGKEALEKSPDYPSGHTIAGWETGLILAQLVPDEESQALTRARAFGESRVVCGVHNASAVEAGWMTATLVFAAQIHAPSFRADLDAARAEIASLHSRKHAQPAACASDAEVLAKSPY